MKEAFDTFLTNTSLDTYFALRDLVTEHPRFQPYSDELKQLNALCEERRFEEMQNLLPAMLPNCLLSPSFHVFAGISSRELGDENAAEAESVVARKLLETLLATGDGTKDRPFHIIRVEDEYDVMAAKGLDVAEQELHQEDGRYLDALSDATGAEVWFDVTIPRSHLDRTMGEPQA